MGYSSAQSSPTTRSPRLSLQQLFSPVLDLGNSVLAVDTNDESAQGTAAPSQEPKPVAESEFFNLQPPLSNASSVRIEDIMKRLFSAEHLHFILGDHGLFLKFSTFLNRFRPQLVPTLIRYLEMRKAMKAIEYSNAVARTIRWPSHADYCKFSQVQPASADVWFKDYAARELAVLCSEALPAFITYTCVGVVTDCVTRDITGQRVPVMQDLVGNLAEVFCLTDPSVDDNPIIFASEGLSNHFTLFISSPRANKTCRISQNHTIRHSLCY